MLIKFWLNPKYYLNTSWMCAYVCKQYSSLGKYSDLQLIG
jgi:hypothetical protein